ncbi:MAG: exodeoxyribonuclease III [Candidatus Aminicenantales bacterium]
MKISTFNVNSVNARKDLIQDWLKHRGEDIDVLCLQEIKCIDEQFPAEPFTRKGFSCAVFGQKGYNGVAVCSRIPIKDVKMGLGDPEWDEQKRVLTIAIDRLSVINVYAPHGGLRGEEKFTYKLDWYQKFLKTLDKRYSPEDPLILVGDFNVARDDLDVYDPQALADTIGTMAEEREAFQALLAWGLSDAFRHLHPNERSFTWWDYIGGAIWRNEGMRIDYILCTRALLDRVKEVEVDLWPRRRRSPAPSDHAPVIATLENVDPDSPA